MQNNKKKVNFEDLFDERGKLFDILKEFREFLNKLKLFCRVIIENFT